MTLNLADLRISYTKGGLTEADLTEDPFELFRQWLQQALDVKATEPNAMTLATVDASGKPNARIVLLKDVGKRHLRFFTNYGSSKGKDLQENPHAATTFWWPELERQVRFRGPVEKIDPEQSAAYFRIRPRESQLGAWASEQSKIISSREELEKKFEQIRKKFSGEEIPVPGFWGGFDLAADEIEFWQGRQGRLHDRILYSYSNKKWNITRLQP